MYEIIVSALLVCWLQCLGMCLGLSRGKSIVALVTFWWGFGFNFQVSWCLKKVFKSFRPPTLICFFVILGRQNDFFCFIFSLHLPFFCLIQSITTELTRKITWPFIHSWANKVPAFYVEWEKFPELVAAWKSLVVRGTSHISIILHMLFRIETICTSVIFPSLPLIPPPFFLIKSVWNKKLTKLILTALFKKKKKGGGGGERITFLMTILKYKEQPKWFSVHSISCF